MVTATHMEQLPTPPCLHLQGHHHHHHLNHHNHHHHHNRHHHRLRRHHGQPSILPYLHQTYSYHQYVTPITRRSSQVPQEWVGEPDYNTRSYSAQKFKEIHVNNRCQACFRESFLRSQVHNHLYKLLYKDYDKF